MLYSITSKLPSPKQDTQSKQVAPGVEPSTCQPVMSYAARRQLLVCLAQARRDRRPPNCEALMRRLREQCSERDGNSHDINIFIDGTPVTTPRAYNALWLLYTTSENYGLPRGSIQVIRQPDRPETINFTQDQILQILNPFEPERLEITEGDLSIRTTGDENTLCRLEFEAIAREFQNRFPRAARIDARLFSTPTQMRERGSQCSMRAARRGDPFLPLPSFYPPRPR